MYRCNFCGLESKFMKPYKGGSASQSEFIKRMDVIGSDLDCFECPKCGSTDRERHLKMYIERLGLFSGNNKSLRILHFAPEPNVVALLKKYEPEIHIFADISPSNPATKQINIQSIPYDDSSFDLVIANHILEHVENVEQALSEINRVLKIDGFAILQTPFSKRLERTFEEKSVISDSDRLFLYGQEDHVRLFGRDIFSTIESSLSSNVFHHHQIFDSSVAPSFGVNEREPFFLYRKKNNDARHEYKPFIEAIKLDSPPVVSICCISYMHEKFIAKALDSFLGQKTNFHFEIVIGDDASTDATPEIIQKYAASHVGKIRVLERSTNQGMHKNLAETLKSCKGKFIALCDGDDYWCDVNKIQKQYDLLAQNDKTVLVYSGVQAHKDGLIDYEYVGGIEKDCTQFELIAMPSINTLTTMFRNVFKKMPDEFYASGAPDLFLWGYLGLFGESKFITGILPAIYNIHAGGIHSSKNMADKLIMHFMSAHALYLMHRRLGHHAAQAYFKRICLNGALHLTSKFGHSAKDKLYTAIKMNSTATMGLLDYDGEALITEIGIHTGRI